ncbi:penicillin-binding transpeptidase domain-containing protein [Streptomyces monticola]|uniref:Penicillin-binding transpeptidase domain-containing protein n=1 Tax=Streptomyces monticola TaxID=2666263 RepID=A0ABW2JJX4_9ACTN
MRSGAKVALVGGVFAVMVGGAGIGAWNLLNGVAGGVDSGDGGPPATKSGPPSAAEVRETAATFLAAWEKGSATDAASYTNYADEAQKALDAYRTDGRITEVKLAPGKADGAKVPFSVTATVTYKKHSKTFSYDSELTVVRGKQSGRPLVDWEPSVLHPNLGEGDALQAGEAPAPPVRALDRSGAELTEKKYPSLGPVLDSLRERYADKLDGTPGVELWIERAGEGAADETLLTLAKGRPGELRTTLSAGAQAAAERAVARHPESSVVAVKPSTGEILAVANHRADGFNAAFQGAMAPGSTMKMVSAALLIDKGLTSASGKAPCPDKAVWQSQQFGNLTGLTADEDATLADSFARSCNTAFVKFADDLQVDDLTNEARRYFGIGADWKAGVITLDGNVPASGGPDTAAALIGQGQVQMNPLNLASVAATIRNGAFRQPVVVPQRLDNRQLATAEPLVGSTAAQLRQMMRHTALSGTGRAAMAGLGPDVGAKTGSADVAGQDRPNSWFAGYRGDIAAAALAQEGGHGGDTAGPIVAEVLRAGG